MSFFMANYCFKIITIILLSLFFCTSYAQVAQRIKVSMDFKDIQGHPAWLFIVYDADSSAVYPYYIEITEFQNFFTIPTYSQNYRIVSVMQFDREHRKIQHFCNLPTGYFTRESLEISIKGILTPNPRTTACSFRRSKNDF
jgi:hypothetical protein